MNTKELNEVLKPYWGKGWDGYVRFSDGWCDFVYDLHNKIVALAPEYSLCQAKEKFGGLRYYYDVPTGTDPEIVSQIDELVNKAEEESFTICEQCGTKQDVDLVLKNRWLITLCKECVAQCPPETISYDVDSRKPIILV